MPCFWELRFKKLQVISHELSRFRRTFGKSEEVVIAGFEIEFGYCDLWFFDVETFEVFDFVEIFAGVGICSSS